MARNGLFSMMMIAVTVAGSTVPLVLGVTQGQAQQRPRPEPEKCLALVQKIGASRVWWGRHVGARERPNSFEWGLRKEYFDRIGCFQTRQECEDWLYWMRSDFPEFTAIKPCRRGL